MLTVLASAPPPRASLELAYGKGSNYKLTGEHKNATTRHGCLTRVLTAALFVVIVCRFYVFYFLFYFYYFLERILSSGQHDGSENALCIAFARSPRLAIRTPPTCPMPASRGQLLPPARPTRLPHSRTLTWSGCRHLSLFSVAYLLPRFPPCSHVRLSVCGHQRLQRWG
jgi:hypothetical protein